MTRLAQRAIGVLVALVIFPSTAGASEPSQAPVLGEDAATCGCPHRGFGHALIAVGAIAAGAAVGFGVAYGLAADAQAEASDRHRQLWAQGAPAGDLEQVAGEARRAHDQAESFSAGAWVATSMGAVALALGIALVVLHTEPEATTPEGEIGAPESAGFVWTPLVGPGSVGIHARF